MMQMMGMIGLGVMGRNLALNMLDHDIDVVGLDRSAENGERFIRESNGRGRLVTDPAELVRELARPRRIMMMVPAGAAVDSVIESLAPALEPGDVIIDGGNSHYADTERRIEALRAQGILFVGAGVSGGARGARRGPSIMPGGREEAWPLISPTLRAIAARADDGEPCCDWLGHGGAGHAVKTIHNGIEYAFMQLICECYALLSRLVEMKPPELAAMFDEWNRGPMRSFLLETTAQIFTVRAVDHGDEQIHDSDDERSVWLVERVLDEAEQKGTGRWTAEMALEYGAPAPMLAEAVFARGVSSRRDLRRRLHESRVVPRSETPPEAQRSRTDLISDLKAALPAAVVIAFAQGFDLIRTVSEAREWNIPLDRVARLWRAGCIIRTAFLDDAADALRGVGREHLLLHDDFRQMIDQGDAALRRVVGLGAASRIGCPAFASALAYLDTVTDPRLPHNLLQAQRDAFGAHQYHRLDRPGAFHTDWLGGGATMRMDSP